MNQLKILDMIYENVVTNRNPISAIELRKVLDLSDPYSKMEELEVLDLAILHRVMKILQTAKKIDKITNGHLKLVS